MLNELNQPCEAAKAQKQAQCLAEGCGCSSAVPVRVQGPTLGQESLYVARGSMIILLNVARMQTKSVCAFAAGSSLVAGFGGATLEPMRVQWK